MQPYAETHTSSVFVCSLIRGTHARKENAVPVSTPCKADLEARGIPGPDGSNVADFAAKRHVDGGEGVGVDVLRLVIQLLVEKHVERERDKERERRERERERERERGVQPG